MVFIMEKKFIPYSLDCSLSEEAVILRNNLLLTKSQNEIIANITAYSLRYALAKLSIANFYNEIWISFIKGCDKISDIVNPPTEQEMEALFNNIIDKTIADINSCFINMYNKQSQQQQQEQSQQQEQQQQPIVTEASAANYSVGDIVNKFIPVQSSAPQTIELTDAQKAEFIMHSDVFKNSVKLDSKINAEVSPRQVLNIWEIIHCDAFKNYLHTKGIPINVSYKQVPNDHEDPNLNMKFEIIGSNGNMLYIGDEKKYIII